MKKGLALMLSILMMLSVAACGAESSGQEENETLGDSSQAVTEEETAATEQGTSAEENSSNSLTVYFSRWGNTEDSDDVDATTSAGIVVDENGRYYLWTGKRAYAGCSGCGCL